MKQSSNIDNDLVYKMQEIEITPTENNKRKREEVYDADSDSSSDFEPIHKRIKLVPILKRKRDEDEIECEKNKKLKIEKCLKRKLLFSFDETPKKKVKFTEVVNSEIEILKQQNEKLSFSCPSVSFFNMPFSKITDIKKQFH